MAFDNIEIDEDDLNQPGLMSDPEEPRHPDYKLEPNTHSAKNRNKSADSELNMVTLQPAAAEEEEVGMRASVIPDDRNQWQKPFEWDDEVDLANKEIFGNEIFRENQREIINSTKSKKDVLALIPTGGGKSLTFQLSAVTDNGVTFVVMPLLSLIEDNLNFVLELSIPAISLSVGNT